MWIVNKNEQKQIDVVKLTRPSCLVRFVKHLFIEYNSENKRTCADCGYTERTIRKD